MRRTVGSPEAPVAATMLVRSVAFGLELSKGVTTYVDRS